MPRVDIQTERKAHKLVQPRKHMRTLVSNVILAKEAWSNAAINNKMKNWQAKHFVHASFGSGVSFFT